MVVCHCSIHGRAQNLKHMKFPEKYRKQMAGFESGIGESGLFALPIVTSLQQYTLAIITSNGEGWDHVSVSVIGSKRTPNWNDMCKVKDLFFEPTETVIQYHPPHSEYVNNHEGCLHLWKKQGYEFPLPPSILVGIK